MVFGSPRQMFSVDMDCAKCGTHITELPFQPSQDKPVYCSECNKAMRSERNDRFGNNRRGGFNRGPRQMYSVNVNCASCGTKITELPFMPSSDKPIYCRECMRSKRDS
jgi:CxxC-x17-CxxC domain-containing protein